MPLMKRISVAAALIALLVPAGFSQTHKSKPREDLSHAIKRAASKSKPKSMRNERWEVFTDVTIGPGQSAVLDSGLDYAGSEMARVSIRSADFDLDKLQLQAYWSVPDADYYNATDAIDGSTFAFGNAGGAKFLVYGSQFRLVLTNNGDATINLQQVILFASAPAPEPD